MAAKIHVLASGAVRSAGMSLSVLVVALVAVVAAGGRLAGAPPAVVLVAPLIVVAFGAVISLGPYACFVGLLFADMLGGYQELSQVGPIGVRVVDAFWLAFVVAALRDRRAFGRPARADIGQVPLALWLLALGASLYPVGIRDSGEFTVPFIALLRLAQTFSLVWLVPYALRRRPDLGAVMRVIEAAIAVEIVWAIIDMAVAGAWGDRLTGAGSANSTGLLAALLVVAAIHAPVPERRSVRVLLLILGVLGLVLTRSLGSTAALAATLGLFGLRRPRPDGGDSRARFLAPARVLLLVVAALAVASTFRPDNLPVSDKFEQSTTVHRAILAYRGIELFLDDPVTGVGWQRAARVFQLDSAQGEAGTLFDDANPQFSTDRNPTHVHNVYIQQLAEAGLLGFSMFLILAIAAFRGIRFVMWQARGDSSTYAHVRALIAMMVAVMVWWNDSALFGAQPDTVIAATLLGILASVPLVQSRRFAGAEPRPLSASREAA